MQACDAKSFHEGPIALGHFSLRLQAETRDSTRSSAKGGEDPEKGPAFLPVDLPVEILRIIEIPHQDRSFDRLSFCRVSAPSLLSWPTEDPALRIDFVRADPTTLCASCRQRYSTTCTLWGSKPPAPAFLESNNARVLTCVTKTAVYPTFTLCNRKNISINQSVALKPIFLQEKNTQPYKPALP